MLMLLERPAAPQAGRRSSLFLMCEKRFGQEVTFGVSKLRPAGHVQPDTFTPTPPPADNVYIL